jgi:SNF2 family DNA or RNA helicase
MERAVKLMVSQGAAGLLLDPGLGKTSISLAAFKILKRRGLVDRMLVIAPLRVCYLVWPEEAKKWTDFHGLKIAVLHGRKKMDALRGDADVLVINPEGLPWLVDHANAMRPWPDMLVVDESTRFKHTRTKRFKLLKKLLPRFRRRYILTGTPAPNGLLDLFGQIYLLDYGTALGRFITHYRMAYFYPTGYGGYTWVLKPGAEEQIHGKLKPLTLRLDAKDYLKLPPKIETDLQVNLNAKAEKVYERLKKDLVLRLKEGEVTAMNAGVLTGKLRQVANGGIYMDDDPMDRGGVQSRKSRYATVHDEKVDLLEELIEELSGQPTLVSFEFRHDRDRILKRLGDTPVLDGSTTAREGIAIERDWNAGKLPVLLVHPQSAAHGLNLQRGGRALIWFALPWDLELYDQLVRRIWRQGQKQRVFVYHLIAKGTVDRLVLETLRRKTRTQRALLDALKKEVL